MKVIMVGVDGSTGADVAFRQAVDLAQLCEAGVFAVAVRPDPGPPSPGGRKRPQLRRTGLESPTYVRL
jgi:nucleotide-binding universal stress UspA family protein